jgi:hypothetical protein
VRRWAPDLVFVLVLVLLHVLRPDLDPSWRFISEYAIGTFGYLMIMAFLSLSAGYVGLFLAIRSQVPTTWGKIGLALLRVSSAGMAIAGVFVTDPITTPATERGMTGRLHEVGALLDLTPLAAPLISWSVPAVIRTGRLLGAPCSGRPGCPFWAC